MSTEPDTRRIVVIDLATDSVTTIIGKASAAPGIGELRERIAAAFRENDRVMDGNYWSAADAVLRVIEAGGA